MTVFALVATLVPMLSLGWLYYSSNRSLLEEKNSQGLENTARNATRELGQWLIDRRQEALIFAASYVVGENIDAAGLGDQQALSRLVAYLESVSARLTDFSALAVADENGRVIATSDPAVVWDIPGHWQEQLPLGEQPLSVPQWQNGRFQLSMGTRVTDLDGHRAGMLLARLHLGRIGRMLGESGALGGDSVYLLDQSARVIAREDSAPVTLGLQLRASVLKILGDSSSSATYFQHADGTAVVGVSASVPGSPWLIVAERRRAEVFADVRRLERLTTLIGMVLVLLSALVAFMFARKLTAPLQRLADGASQVAAGDLSVQVPVQGRNELAYLTRVFNDMVKRINAGHDERDQINQQLREQNQQLQLISNTDPLTGLYNRQHLNGRLARLIDTSRKRRKPFALLMIDLDHFKNLNDKHGHLGGDRALRWTANLLSETVRSGDYVARFGGEEFLVLLPGADGPRAAAIGERLRQEISERPIQLETGDVRVTMSIGIAVYPDAGTDMDVLIKIADQALYRAKAEGRDRCYQAAVRNLRAIS